MQVDLQLLREGLLEGSVGADASAIQKSTQELQQELRLAQAVEMANTQELRFKALLKDLNSSAAELVSNIDQVRQMNSVL